MLRWLKRKKVKRSIENDFFDQRIYDGVMLHNIQTPLRSTVTNGHANRSQ